MRNKSIYGIDKCPNCGGGSFYVSQYISGYGYFYGNLDGTEADNSELHAGLEYRTTWKYARCADCDKKLFKITPDMNL